LDVLLDGLVNGFLGSMVSRGVRAIEANMAAPRCGDNREIIER